MTPLVRRIARRIALICGIALLGCAGRDSAVITLDPESRPWRPAFSITGPEAPVFIAFKPSDGQRDRSRRPDVWTVFRDSGVSQQSPLTVEFGVVPVGYHAAMPAPQLAPGDYEVVAKLTHGSGALRFRIATDGSVRAE